MGAKAGRGVRCGSTRADANTADARATGRTRTNSTTHLALRSCDRPEGRGRHAEPSADLDGGRDQAARRRLWRCRQTRRRDQATARRRRRGRWHHPPNGDGSPAAFGAATQRVLRSAAGQRTAVVVAATVCVWSLTRMTTRRRGAPGPSGDDPKANAWKSHRPAGEQDHRVAPRVVSGGWRFRSLPRRTRTGSSESLLSCCGGYGFSRCGHSASAGISPRPIEHFLRQRQELLGARGAARTLRRPPSPGSRSDQPPARVEHDAQFLRHRMHRTTGKNIFARHAPSVVSRAAPAGRVPGSRNSSCLPQESNTKRGEEKADSVSLARSR